MKSTASLEISDNTGNLMKPLTTALAVLCLAAVATMTVCTQANRQSRQAHKKAPQPVWEIIHRTDCTR